MMEEKIKAWKAKYGKVYEIVVDGHHCYLKPPTRQILSLVLSYERTDPLKADEALLQNCWLDGDEVIKTDINLLLSVRGQLAELFELKKSKLLKH